VVTASTARIGCRPSRSRKAVERPSPPSEKYGAGDVLHNLVFACGSCNRSKGGADLLPFSAEVDIEYITMLESDLARCIRMIASENG
jgi:hypothetical protein